jgi:two-component system response regulator TctD
VRGKRILLVEDDENVQRFVSRLMELEGASLSVSGTAEDGEALLEAGHFDLVIVDINLPGRSGWDLLQEAKGRGTPCPMVVFTASVNPEYEQRALSLGAAGFITKPVGARELVERLKTFLAE